VSDTTPVDRLWSLIVLVTWSDRRNLGRADRLRRRGLLSAGMSAVIVVAVLTRHGVV
jgi:hypothetical protein